MQPYWEWENLPPYRDRYWVGENFQEAKVRARQDRSWAAMYGYLALHWLGDPTVNVWSCFRGGLQLEFTPRSIPRETPTTIQATVLDAQGSPVSRAWVGLYQENPANPLEPGLLQSGATDNGGVVTFPAVYAPYEGLLLVTAFKDWYRPAEGYILVGRGGDRAEGGAQEGAGYFGAETAPVGLSLRPVQTGEVRMTASASRPTALEMTLYDASGRALGPARHVQLDRGVHSLSLSGPCATGVLSPGVYFIRYSAPGAGGILRFSYAR